MAQNIDPWIIETTLDSRLAAVWGDALQQSTAAWEAVTNYTFKVVPLGAPFRIVPHDELVTLPGAGVLRGSEAGFIGYGEVAYVGLPYDPTNLIRLGYGKAGALTHEIGHRLGIPDGQGGLYDYARPIGGYSIRNVQWVQQHDGGISSRNDNVKLYGDDDGSMLAGPGADTVTGAAGNEMIYGNQGADRLLGNGGADTLYGGQDNDILSGGSGADWLYGNRGGDALSGGVGDDWLHGGRGDDTLSGGDGADTLNGGIGNDVIHADDFDQISGGDGADTVYGGGSWGDFDPSQGDRWFNEDGTTRVELAGVPSADPFDPMTGA